MIAARNRNPGTRVDTGIWMSARTNTAIPIRIAMSAAWRSPNG